MARKSNELDRINRQGRMKVIKLIFGLLCAVIIVLYSVGNNVYNRAGADNGNDSVKAGSLNESSNNGSIAERTFPAVEVPMYLQADNKGVMEWLAVHYWDKWLNADTLNNELTDKVLAEAFAGYVNVLLQVEYEKACKGIGDMFVKLDGKGSRKALLGVMKAAETVLFDPNSPMLDEELYIPVLEGILASKMLSEDDKLAYRANYDIVKINRKGTRARDFEYIYLTGDGKGKKLSSLYQTRAEYLIVYFNNPGCTSCKEIKQRLSQELFIKHLIERKELVVLSVYTDEDLQQWEGNFNDFPKEWIYAADPTASIKDDNRWGIRAIPSLYLLDKDKKVLLKDTSIEAIISLLGGQ